MNLAINARDAMPHGGKIVMETAEMDVEGERARALELGPGRYVLLQGSDTGHGMDAATMGHLFEPFFTPRKMGKGTGLGLATVYGGVKQSGCSIQRERDAGRGGALRPSLRSGTG